MDYRENNFKTKFSNAALLLGVNHDQVVSLKLRENVSSYGEYRDLVMNLERDVGLKCSKLDVDLQGRGYLLDQGKTKVIVVEHETGLELLYVAGSIASLIGLVPLILQGWRALRSHFQHRHTGSTHPIEIRRIDAAGHLQEEHVHDDFIEQIVGLNMLPKVLATSAKLIETEVKSVNHQLQLLADRVGTLESQIANTRPTGKKKIKVNQERSMKTGNRSKTKA